MKLSNVIGGALALGAVASTDVEAGRLDELLRPTPEVTIVPAAMYAACNVKEGVGPDADFQRVVDASANFAGPLATALRMPSRQEARAQQATLTAAEVTAIVNPGSVGELSTRLSSIYKTSVREEEEGIRRAIGAIEEIVVELENMQKTLDSVVDKDGNVDRVRGDYREDVRRATVMDAFENDLQTMSCRGAIVDLTLGLNNFPTLAQILKEAGGIVAEQGTQAPQGEKTEEAKKEILPGMDKKELGVELLKRLATAGELLASVEFRMEAFYAAYNDKNGL